MRIGGPRRRALGALVLATVALLVPTALTGASAAPSGTTASASASIDAAAATAGGRRGATAGATGVVPTDIVDRYLTRKPSLGPVRIAQIAGSSNSTKLLAATLQGIVNRTSARLYLVGMRDAGEDQQWIDDYVARSLVTVSATGDLGAALDAYKAEVAGYVVASEAEPWTINTATTAAAALGGVVATPDQIAGLESRGIHQLDDHRGRWTDAATAYEATAATYRAQLPYQGLAIQQPDRHQPRDLLVQQGVMAVYTRPSQSDYDRVYALFDGLPTDHPVYGYVADNGTEEVQAVARLSQAGRFLVATDTTDNLSFHIAVGASTPRATATAPTPPTTPCTSDQVNVVLSVSDGDNLVIPEGRYPTPSRWNSPRRGELALGWSIGESAAVLMPSIWDRFASTTTSRDEIVGMMGIGYAYTSLMPNGATYFADSFRLDAVLGLRTHWTLDALLGTPDAAGWALVHQGAATAGSQPEGFLMDYLDFGGPSPFHTPDGVPVLKSRQGAYEDGPTELAAQISALAALPASQRPIVTFYAVTAWNAPLDQLVDLLAPLEAQGVRFLTPAEALACVPDPPTTTTTTTAAPTTTAPGPTTTTAGPGTGALPVTTSAGSVTPAFTG
ncbi:MAG: GxGYxYP family putative glycoside hydrolase [Acidimicrobiales bacterium]